MATFHHQIKSGKRGTAVTHSDYIGRNGKHRGREDVVMTGHGNMPPWSNDDPRRFWREADKNERQNGAAYREHEIALPIELTMDENEKVVRQHVADIAGNKPHQFAVHVAESSLEGRLNVHLHLMVSDRVPDGIARTPEQMFRRYNAVRPERGGCRKDSGGLDPLALRDKVIELRKRTADVQNAALADNGHMVRVDHRSLKEQGRCRKAEHHLGQARIRKMSKEIKESIVAGRRKDNQGG